MSMDWLTNNWGFLVAVVCILILVAVFFRRPPRA